ncbi:MAG: glycosyltransferase [Chromatiaceae bacterium]|nr:glycosyltransferase [Chromatiaceae bacterium]MCP5314873.1 glycosyltransferase [Chromatiaceae bacterium]
MKTLQIVGSKQIAGAERWFLRFVRTLQARGDEPVAVVRRGSELDGEALAGVRHAALPLRTVWDPLSRWEVSRLIARERPALVQTYMGRATRLTHLDPRRGIVHVARLGGYYKLDGYRHAHAWIGNTRGLCDYLVGAGFPAARVFHIYNFAEPVRAVDAGELHALRERLAVEPDDLLLLTAGRFVTVKGQRYLLEALARLPDTLGGRRLRLVMLGDGPLADDLHRQARDSGIAQRIVWAGWQTDTAPWYALADLVVFPSRDAETLGNVVLEAWAHRKPLVTTLFRGAREITSHGTDAWCVPCDDPPALAEALRTVIADPALQRQLVDGGSDSLARNFSEAAVMSQYDALYQQLTTAGPV